MARYSYIAQSLSGEEKAGVLEAEDIHQLARNLKREGLILVKAELEGKEKKKFEISLPSLGGVSLIEKMFFTRNLRVMIGAGLPLPKAIRILADQAKSKRFKTALLEIEEEITKGKSFAEAMAKYPDIFPDLFQSMIKVGGEAGTLEDVLNILTQQMERESELRSKIKSAMIYPAVIISTMIGIGILMLIMVVPKLAETFAELNIELPITTKIVIGFANFLTKKWYLVIGLLIFFIFIVLRALKTTVGKKIIDNFTLKIPVIASIIRNTNSAYTVRTLSSLISAGVSLPRSLEITAGTLGNIYYKTAISQAVEKVRKGGKLSEALKPYENIYPLTVIQMIAVGEETGETSTILAKLADFFETEVGNATKNFASVIEPVLMLAIGAAVGFFAISMVQPMYSMLGAIK